MLKEAINKALSIICQFDFPVYSFSFNVRDINIELLCGYGPGPVIIVDISEEEEIIFLPDETDKILQFLIENNIRDDFIYELERLILLRS